MNYTGSLSLEPCDHGVPCTNSALCQDLLLDGSGGFQVNPPMRSGALAVDGIVNVANTMRRTEIISDVSPRFPTASVLYGWRRLAFSWMSLHLRISSSNVSSSPRSIPSSTILA